MEELISLDELTQMSVGVVKKKYTEIEGTRYFLGDPHRTAYVNSISGRNEIAQALSEPYLSAVIALWGRYSDCAGTGNRQQRISLIIAF